MGKNVEGLSMKSDYICKYGHQSEEICVKTGCAKTRIFSSAELGILVKFGELIAVIPTRSNVPFYDQGSILVFRDGAKQWMHKTMVTLLLKEIKSSGRSYRDDLPPSSVGVEIPKHVTETLDEIYSPPNTAEEAREREADEDRFPGVLYRKNIFSLSLDEVKRNLVFVYHFDNKREEEVIPLDLFWDIFGEGILRHIADKKGQNDNHET